jgi:hypothetical protein
MINQQILIQHGRRKQWECAYRIPNLLVTKAGTVLSFPQERIDSMADESKHHIARWATGRGGRKRSRCSRPAWPTALA